MGCGLWFVVCGLWVVGCGVVGWSLEFMVQGLGIRVGFGVWGLGFVVWGLGFVVWGLGFGDWGLRCVPIGLGFARYSTLDPIPSHHPSNVNR